MSNLKNIRDISVLIHTIRGHRVMVDSDLSKLYQVETGQLNRAVKRNGERFPRDFMFQLSTQEFNDLKCQFGISSSWGGRRKPPYVFTEQGVAMLSSVLKSREAALVNVHIMRTFVKMREAILAHEELALKLDQLEYRVGNHDEEIAALFEAIKQLMEPVKGKKKAPMGFGRSKG